MKAASMAALGAFVLIASMLLPVVTMAKAKVPVIDQAIESPGELYRFQLDEDSADYHGLAQTVAAGTDGLLVAVDLFLAREGWTTAALVVEIRRDGPSGPLLATSKPVEPAEIPVVSEAPPMSPPMSPPVSPPVSAPIPAPARAEVQQVDVGGEWVEVTFPKPAVIRAGDVIAITTQIPDPLPDGEPAGPAWYWAWSEAGAPQPDDYAGGVAWGGYRGYDGTLHWGSWYDGSDLSVRTRVQPRHVPQKPDSSGLLLKGDEGRVWLEFSDGCVRHSLWLSVLVGTMKPVGPGAKPEPVARALGWQDDFNVCGKEDVLLDTWAGEVELGPDQVSITPLERVELKDVTVDMWLDDSLRSFTFDLVWTAQGAHAVRVDRTDPAVNQQERMVSAEMTGTVLNPWGLDIDLMWGEISRLTQITKPR